MTNQLPVKATPLTPKERLKEYWPLMIGGACILGLVVYALFPAIPISGQGRWVVMTGDVLSTSSAGVTFENLTLKAGYDTRQNQQLIEGYRSDAGYVFDLEWYNTHVWEGFRYEVAVYYDNGELLAGPVTSCK